MVPTCNWHIFLPLILILDVAVILDLFLYDMTNATRILKINMKCHLKQNDHSFYHHIPIFNYVNFHILHT